MKLKKTWEEKLTIVLQTFGIKTLVQVAKENEVETQTLRTWVKSYRKYGVDGLRLSNKERSKIQTMNVTKDEEVPAFKNAKEELKYLRQNWHI